MDDPNINDHTVCSICYEDFDDTTHVPKTLSCHHYFCTICIQAIAKGAHQIRCPNCRETTLVEQLQTNHVVVSFTQHFKYEQLKTDQLHEKAKDIELKLLDVKNKICEKTKEVADYEKKHQHLLLGTSSKKRQKSSDCSTFKASSSFQEPSCTGQNSNSVESESSNKSPQLLDQMASQESNLRSTTKQELDRLNQAIKARDLVIKAQKVRISALTQELLVAKQTIVKLEGNFSKKQ